MPTDNWLPIATAPKDGTEILAWRKDTGVMIARWDCPSAFMTEKECEAIGPAADEYDWMCADFVQGCRLEGSDVPTHWMPIPDGPTILPLTPSENRRVVCAAMLMDDGLVVAGTRHYSPDMRRILHRLYGEMYHLRVKEQGFIDSHNTFLSRKNAWVLADHNGQIFCYDPSGKGKLIPQPANEGKTELLFSENLY